MRQLAFVTLALVLAGAGVPAASPGDMARVGPGVLHPVYAPAPGVTTVDVAAFALDRLPVTNAEFLHFVTGHPGWRRDRVARVARGREAGRLLALYGVSRIRLGFDRPVEEVWDEHLAGHGAEVEACGLGRLVWASPFLPTIPGTDTYTEEL